MAQHLTLLSYERNNHTSILPRKKLSNVTYRPTFSATICKVLGYFIFVNAATAKVDDGPTECVSTQMLSNHINERKGI